MNRSIKKIISVIFAFALIFSLVPLSFAESIDEVNKDLLYGRSRLAFMANGEKLVEAYDRIYECVEERENEAYLSDLVISETELKTVVSAYRNDPSGHFWNSTTFSYSLFTEKHIIAFVPVYNDLAGKNDAEFSKNKKAFDNAVNAVIKKAGIKNGMSQFEKEHLIHDVLIGDTDYIDTVHAHTAYGALVEHKAVCDGYSRAFQYILRLLGIQAHMVEGIAGGGGHAWNLVRIDGDYYYADITWDDPLGGDDDEDDFFHAYFNVTESYLRRDHDWEEPAYGLPHCESSAANLYTVDPERTVDCDCSLATMASLFNKGTAYIHIAGDANVFFSWLFANAYDIAVLAGYDTTKPLSFSYVNMNEEYRIRINGTFLPGEEEPILKGDIDGDGQITALDSNLIKRAMVGSAQLSDIQISAADINNDGLVDSIDANLLKRILVGKL